MRITGSRLAVAAAALASALASLTLAAGDASPSVPVVLHAARLLDVDSGRLLMPGEILVRGERIAAVGGSVEHPAAHA